MRYTVTRQRIDVIGHIWQPGVGLCAMSKDLDAHEFEQIGDPRNRADVAAWIDTHFGDFQAVTDFRADFHIGNAHVVHDWQSEESALTFADCMFPE